MQWQRLEEGMGDFKQVPTIILPFVMPPDVYEHCARMICVRDHPSDSVWLLGAGGSDRQSPARPSSYPCDFEGSQIEDVQGYNQDVEKGTNAGDQGWYQLRHPSVMDYGMTFWNA